MSLMGLDASVISKDNSKSRQNRPWITNEEVIAMPSAFGISYLDIVKDIKPGLEKEGLSYREQRDICLQIWYSSYFEGLPGRSALGQNGAGFGPGGLVRISCVDEGWSGDWMSRSKEDASVGTMVFMPDTGAIRCFERPFPRSEGPIPRDSEEARPFAGLRYIIELAKPLSALGRLTSARADDLEEIKVPLSSIKLNTFPRDEASVSLIKEIRSKAPQLSEEQIVEIITPLLNRLDDVSGNITKSLCGKLIPFARDIVKSGQPLELNAYNFTTTAGTDNEKVYRWAQAQYQPLITLLQRMEPNKLADLVNAISKGKGEAEINAEMAKLFQCSAHLISVLSTTRPDVKQLSLVVTPGRSDHVTDDWKGLIMGVPEDRRSVLHRLMSLYSHLDDKGAEKLTNIFQAAKRNELSLEQVAFALLCGDRENVSQEQAVVILPQLLRDIKDDKPMSYSNLNKFKAWVSTLVTDLEFSMVRPLLSERAGYIKALVGEDDDQNLSVDKIIGKIMQQKGIEPDNYVELARKLDLESVEKLIMEWPLGKPFSKRASLLTFCLAIMGGMDGSEIDQSLQDFNQSEMGLLFDKVAHQPGLSSEDEEESGFIILRCDEGDENRNIELLKVGANGKFCKITPVVNADWSRSFSRFILDCRITDPAGVESLGTLSLRVEQNGNSYKVATGRVKIGGQYSDSFDEDGKLPMGYEALGPDIREFVDGLNSKTIDPELFQRIGDEVEKFKVALSQKIHEVITRLHPEPPGGFGEAIAIAHTRLSKIFDWLNDLPTMWKLTKDVNRLMD